MRAAALFASVAFLHFAATGLAQTPGQAPATADCATAMTRGMSPATTQVCLAEAELARAESAGKGSQEWRRLLEAAALLYKRTLGLPADEVVRNWQEIKAAERRAKGGDQGILASVPRALPALPRAQQVGDKLAHVGFDWPDLKATLAKVDEERNELRAAVAAGDTAAAARELGDLLLTLTSVARHLGVAAEIVLRDATERLSRRVAHVEAAARATGRDLARLDPAERDRLWDAAKADEV